MDSCKMYLVDIEQCNDDLIYKIASLWSAYLGAEVYADDVPMMMLLLEIAGKKVLN